MTGLAPLQTLVILVKDPEGDMIYEDEETFGGNHLSLVRGERFYRIRLEHRTSLSIEEALAVNQALARIFGVRWCTPDRIIPDGLTASSNYEEMRVIMNQSNPERFPLGPL